MYSLDEFIVRLQELRPIAGGDATVMISKDDVFEIAAVEVDKVDPKFVTANGDLLFRRGRGQVIISVF
jgi:hypothetical protein